MDKLFADYEKQTLDRIAALQTVSDERQAAISDIDKVFAEKTQKLQDAAAESEVAFGKALAEYRQNEDKANQSNNGNQSDKEQTARTTSTGRAKKA